jgi:hypothetical protein
MVLTKPHTIYRFLNIYSARALSLSLLELYLSIFSLSQALQIRLEISQLELRLDAFVLVLRCNAEPRNRTKVLGCVVASGDC